MGKRNRAGRRKKKLEETEERYSTIKRKQKPAPPRLTLAKLPLEIKQTIVYWLDQIPLDDPEDLDDDDDFDDRYQSWSRNNDYYGGNTYHSNWHPGRYNPFSSDSDDYQPKEEKKKPIKFTKPVLALSLVDRMFHSICRPFIWKDMNFDESSCTRLKTFRRQILPRQVEFVRSIFWRAITNELELYLEGGWTGELEGDFNPNLRETEIVGILESCKKLTKLDFDLRCPKQVLDEEWFDTEEYHQPTWSFAEPVSKLTELTSICLTATNEKPFDEQFLVQLIRDLNLIQSFKCCGIQASAPAIEASSKSTLICRSPLALRLASLGALRSLELEHAECFDGTWSMIEWKGRLEIISLSKCSRVSPKEINQFRMKFGRIPTGQSKIASIANQT